MVKGSNMTTPHGAMQSLRRRALVLAAALALAACGGGEPDVPQAGPAPGPATFAVAAPPPPPFTPGDNAGATKTYPTGTLHYMVFSASSVASGTATLATAAISHGATAHDITFAAPGAFPTGLTIHQDLISASVDTWNGVQYNGGVPNKPWPEEEKGDYAVSGGLLSGGNFFVYCSAGMSYHPVGGTFPGLEPASRAGAKVAVSGNFVAMTDIGPLYGKTFKRFDCTDSAPNTTFGDRNGNFTMAFGGVNLSPAEVVTAFSSAGFTKDGATYKRRAYQITLNGKTQYAIVALDQAVGGGNPTASVLYQFN